MVTARKYRNRASKLVILSIGSRREGNAFDLPVRARSATVLSLRPLCFSVEPSRSAGERDGLQIKGIAQNSCRARFDAHSKRGTERCYGASGKDVATWSLQSNRWSAAMPQPNDLSRSLVALDHDSTIIAVVELSQSSWLVGGVLPGIERQPRKKLEPSPERLLAVLHRWRDEAVKAGRNITRIALAFEAVLDGFWLARWLEARGVEA